MGLAWTAMGVDTLYIEAAAVEASQGKGSLRTTGKHHGIPHGVRLFSSSLASLSC